jgi:REP element-mobilizing transposase RayT
MKRDDYPGAWHHVMNRGQRRQKVFLEDGHCLKFLDVLSEAVDRFGIEVHAYSLMPNHYHLLIRSPEGTLSPAMRHINGVYTQWLNYMKKWDGPLFRGRFNSQLVEREDHLRLLVAYIHLNPLKAHLIKRLDSEAWTSHRAYLGKESAPDWLSIRFMTELFGGADALHAFVRSVHTKTIEFPDDFDPETGLFKQKGIERRIMRFDRQPESANASRSTRFLPPGEVLAMVMRITGSELAELKTVTRGPGANPARRFAIWALSHKAGLSHKDIARTLSASPRQVANLLDRVRKFEPKPPLRDWIERFREEDA